MWRDPSTLRRTIISLRLEPKTTRARGGALVVSSRYDPFGLNDTNKRTSWMPHGLMNERTRLSDRASCVALVVTARVTRAPVMFLPRCQWVCCWTAVLCSAEVSIIVNFTWIIWTSKHLMALSVFVYDCCQPSCLLTPRCLSSIRAPHMWDACLNIVQPLPCSAPTIQGSLMSSVPEDRLQ